MNYGTDDEGQPLLGKSNKSESCKDNKWTPPWKCHRLVTVEPVVILYVLAAQTTLPLLQQYVHAEIYESHNVTDQVENATCGTQQQQDNSTNDIMDKINSEISLLNSLLMIAATLPGLFVLFFLGPYSDHLGRRALIIPPLCGMLVSRIMFVVIVFFSINIYTLVFSILIGDLFGGYACVMSGSYSYIADVTSHEQRTKRLVIIEVISGFAVLIGQLTLGYVINSLGFLWGFVLEMIISAVAIFYAILFLPESIERKPMKKYCQCPNLTQSVMLFIRDDGSKRRLILLLGSLLVFFIGFLDSGLLFVLNFYLLDPPLCLDSRYIGAYNGLVFVVKALGSLLLTQLLIGRFSETALVLIGCISILLYFLALSVTKQLVVLFAGAVLSFAVMVPLPTLRSLMSKLVGAEEQGALFAALGITHTSSATVSSIIFNMMYASFTHSIHGLIWLVTAAITLIPLLITGILRAKMSHRESRVHLQNTLRRPTIHITGNSDSSQEQVEGAAGWKASSTIEEEQEEEERQEEDETMNEEGNTLE